MTPGKKWFLKASAASFLSAVSFIQTQQLVSEKTGTGLWIVLGIVFAALAAYSFIKVGKYSN